MYRDYRDKDVQFFYVYSNVQHPEINNFVAPYNVKERLMHIEEIVRRSKSEMPWLCDNMKHDLKSALRAAPNGEYVFDKDGKMIRKRFWSDPNTLRQDLETLVGKVDKPTKVEDLPTRFVVEKRTIASGVVPRIQIPGRMAALEIEPMGAKKDEAPFYVKLRAEMSGRVVMGGQKKGKLYLGFYLDPLYKVHWNNKMAPIKVQIDGGECLSVNESKLTGPKVKEAADVDPRQFLVDVELKDAKKEFVVTVSYAACDDAETFCIPLTQKYKIKINRDRFGGSRPGVFMPQMFANVRQHDKNKDGTITADELPKGQVTLFIGHMDKNNDNQISAKEIEEFEQMFNNGKGFESDKNDGG